MRGVLFYVFGGKNTHLRAGQVLNVNGVLHFDGTTFRILPRGDSDIEFKFLDVGNPKAELALSVRPNPGPLHQIRFSIPKKAKVDLGVYDLQGRLVNRLASGMMDAGSYGRVWSGRNTEGRQVGPGVFFYRLKVGNEVRTVRAIRID